MIFLFRYSLFILGAFILISSCKNQSYYNHSKWTLPGDSDHKLKGKPTEVKETLFLHLSDTTVNAKGEENNYDLYRFDSEGNLVWQQYSSSNDSFIMITESHFSNQGYLMESYHKANSNNTDQFFASVTPFKGKFLRKNSYGRSFELISYNDKGNIEKVEHIKDTLHPQDIFQTEIWYYKNDLPQKIEITYSDKKKGEQKYFYSQDFLDSIHVIINSKLESRRIYINNKFGDADSFIAYNNKGDTLGYSTSKYVYDQQGNWIRKLEKRKLDLVDMRSALSFEYNLVVREIKY